MMITNQAGKCPVSKWGRWSLVGIAFLFLIKGMLWLGVIYMGVEIFKYKFNGNNVRLRNQSYRYSKRN